MGTFRIHSHYLPALIHNPGSYLDPHFLLFPRKERARKFVGSKLDHPRPSDLHLGHDAS